LAKEHPSVFLCCVAQCLHQCVHRHQQHRQHCHNFSAQWLFSMDQNRLLFQDQRHLDHHHHYMLPRCLQISSYITNFALVCTSTPQLKAKNQCHCKHPSTSHILT
jgi:hypothetical protein